MISTETRAKLFRELGIEDTVENLDHFYLLIRVLRLYDERTRSYGQIWRQYGAMNNLVRGATKVDRLMKVWWHEHHLLPNLHKDQLDDAYDAINYLAFFIRCAQEFNISGRPPMRPLDDSEVR